MPYADCMRKIHAAGSLAAALALASGTAGAQSQPTPSGPPANYQKPQPLILEKQQLGTSAFAIVARTRMRNGDCAGALDVFDAAVAHSIDPTLRRDRGICHEQLGHPFAAIDDYRAYLTEEPDAPDAEGIRGRLGRLEQDNTGRSSNGDDDDVPPATGGASATVTVGTGGAGGDAQVSAGGSSKPRDAMDYIEHDNDQMKSPLRLGKGFSVAPYFSEHKWFFQNSNFGDSFTWAEAVGLQFRYSFGHVTTLFIEAAYQRFNSTAGAAGSVQASIQGLTSQIGLELRFPLDADYDNQLFFGPGIGFDHIVESLNLAGAPSTSLGAIVPRARFGYRHLVAASAGIDISLDAGMGKFALYSDPATGGSDFPFNGPGSETALVALNIALLWGL
jgi:hypothetical protein